MNTSKNKLFYSAKIYATRFDWAVLPLHSVFENRELGCTCYKSNCKSPGKHPYTTNGCKDASKDISVIRNWWEKWPSANVGIATGSSSGFFVLDVDGETGEESLKDLEDEYGKLPDTIEALTGGGGRHILFEHPNGTIKNRVGLFPGLDIRAESGYIVAPPSSHLSGRRYEWEVSYRPGEVGMAKAPSWLLSLICRKEEQRSRKEEQRSRMEADEWKKLACSNVPQGERNNRLVQITGHLLRRNVAAFLAEELVQTWNLEHCKPPLTKEEVKRIVESIAGAELKRRRIHA